MNDLHLDEAEYALLIAINIFSAGQYSQQENAAYGNSLVVKLTVHSCRNEAWITYVIYYYVSIVLFLC